MSDSPVSRDDGGGGVPREPAEGEEIPLTPVGKSKTRERKKPKRTKSRGENSCDFFFFNFFFFYLFI